MNKLHTDTKDKETEKKAEDGAGKRKKRVDQDA